MKARKTIATSLAVVMLTAVAGCSSNSSTTTTTTNSTSTTNSTNVAELVSAPTSYIYTPPEELVGKANAFKGITIGFSQRAISGSSWYENLIRVAKAEADHLGVKLVVDDAQSNLAKQTSDIEDLIAQQVDSVIVNPVDPSGILASTDKLHKAGIPIIDVNSEMDPKANPQSFVGHDTYSVGYSAGSAFAEQYDAHYGNKQGIKAAILMGYPKELYSLYESNGMMAGFNSYFLQKYNSLNLNVVAVRYGKWASDEALKQTEDILAAHPDLNVLFVLDNNMLMGAMSAIQSAGLKDKIKICAAGGTKDQIKLISDPNSGVLAGATGDPRQEAKWAVFMAAVAAKKESVPQLFYIDSEPITIKNAASLYDKNSAF